MLLLFLLTVHYTIKPKPVFSRISPPICNQTLPPVETVWQTQIKRVQNSNNPCGFCPRIYIFILVFIRPFQASQHLNNHTPSFVQPPRTLPHLPPRTITSAHCRRGLAPLSHRPRQSTTLRSQHSALSLSLLAARANVKIEARAQSASPAPAGQSSRHRARART